MAKRRINSLRGLAFQPILYLLETLAFFSEYDKMSLKKQKDILKDLTTVITVSTICLPDTKQVKKPLQNKDIRLKFLEIIVN